MTSTDQTAPEETSFAAEYYRALFQQADDGIFVSDEHGRYTMANPAGHRLLGYAPGELVGRRVVELMAPSELPRLEERLATIQAGAVAVEQYRYLRKDGTTFAGELKAQRLSDGRLLCVVRDVTERMRAEQRVRASEARLRSVLNTAPGVILTVDREGTIEFINHVLPIHKEEQIVGASCFDFVRPERRARVRQAIDHVFATGEIDEYEIDSPAEFGEWRRSYVRVGPIVEDSRVRAVTMCAIDITRRVEAEEARAQLESQLRQAQKEEGIGRLAGGVAHDFNNLLTSILGFADLARGALPVDSAAADSLDQITLAAERGAALTQQLLAFARRKVIQPEVFDPNDVLRRVRPMLERLLGEDVHLELRLSSTCRVKADVAGMEQVVLNLAINARDAMPRGGNLVLESEDLPAGAATPLAHLGTAVWTLSVTDTGAGMPPGVLEHAFEPFFTTKPLGQGTGLGLSMCQGTIKQAGGQIVASSVEGEGTTFRIYLAACAPEPPRSVRPLRDEHAQQGTETLLVVEDDGAILRMAERVLSGLGYHVLTATDGDEAVEVFAAASRRVDLVVTDVVMTRMGGPELAQHLARVAPSVKVLFTSGYMEDVMARHGALPEGVDLLEKPYTPSTLAAKVRELLGPRRPERKP